MLQLDDSRKKLGRRVRGAVHQDDQLPGEYFAAAGLGDLRFQFLAAHAIRDFQIVVEEVAEHAFEGHDIASGIAAQIDDESLVLAGVIKNAVDLALLDEKFRIFHIITSPAST